MHLVVIGGSDAGVNAALRAKEMDPSCKVTLVAADAHPNYSICGAAYYLGGQVQDWKMMAHRTVDQLEEAGIEVLTDHWATMVVPESHRVSLLDKKDGSSKELAYDKLVVATGAEPALPPIKGISALGPRENLFSLHTVGDMLLLAEAVERSTTEKVLIIGGGFIGIELADALSERGLFPVLLEATAQLMPSLLPELAKRIEDELDARGVQVVTNVHIERISKTESGISLDDTSGKSYYGDVCVVVTGVKPNTSLLPGARKGAKGAIAVDRQMRTSFQDIYAAGDCAETYHRITEENTYLPLGTTAHKQGRVAGENAVGGDRSFAGSVGTQVVKVGNLAVGRTGLDPREAKGFDLVATTTELPDHKSYYPGASTIYMTMYANRKDHRLLGVQMLGALSASVPKRLDIVATSLYAGMRIEEISDLDLSYAPPFSSPFDPLAMCADQLATDLRGMC
ncbi:MAG: FAD-dependent oxidoreductase [Actinobacteria bacterium]|jgi:NADPH-dependent 2,4-dienoyl-CoA reductase/sulfur reductase-like enzyme|nr:FAD-dependent oxidoreductase [Actinomycetota bacterium]